MRRPKLNTHSRPTLRALQLAATLLLPASSASATDSDIQLWPSATLNRGLSDQWAGHVTIRGRFDDDVSETKDLLIRPFVTWRPGKGFTLDLGYDYLHSYSGSSENRFWQAAQHAFKWREITVGNRIRLDQRWVKGVDGAVARFRYRFRATRPIGGKDSSWYGVISDEVLTNLNDQGSGPVSGFEQNRLRFAAGVKLPVRFRVEAGYEYQYVESRSGPSTNVHMFLVELAIDTGDGPILGWSPR